MMIQPDPRPVVRYCWKCGHLIHQDGRPICPKKTKLFLGPILVVLNCYQFVEKTP